MVLKGLLIPLLLAAVAILAGIDAIVQVGLNGTQQVQQLEMKVNRSLE
jgi:hypothetical protein